MSQDRALHFAAVVPAVILATLLATRPCGAQSSAVLGEGSYLTALPPGAKGPPETIYKTERITGATPTNRWWSSLAWLPFSERQFPHPLAVQAESSGLRVFYPGTRIHVTEKTIFAGMPGGGEDLVLGHSAQPEFPDARLDAHSDWFVRARFSAAGRSMTVSYGHGSPYVYAVYEGGSPQVTFARDAEVWAGLPETGTGADRPDRSQFPSATLGVTADGKHYGLFGPQDSTWSVRDRRKFINAAAGKRYFSLAILPERSKAVLELFQQHAHAHVTDTRAAWTYDPAASTVEPTFSYTTAATEGHQTETLFALYPHQWQATTAPLLPYSYPSIRGPMKLGRGTQFVTRHVYPGVLPVLPKTPKENMRQVQELLSKEPDVLGAVPKDTYWEGKALGKLATLSAVAEQIDAAATADRHRDQLRQRLEHWFTATDAQGRRNAPACSPTIGTGAR